MITTRIKELFDKNAEAFGIKSTYQLSLLLGLSRQSTGVLVKKKDLFRIELDTVERLCKLFNVMPDDLFDIVNDDGSEWEPEQKKETPPSV